MYEQKQNNGKLFFLLLYIQNVQRLTHNSPMSMRYGMIPVNSPLHPLSMFDTGIILCMHPANERWCYYVTPSLIGWAQTRNDLC